MYKVLNKEFNTELDFILYFNADNYANIKYLADFNNISVSNLLDFKLKGKKINYPKIHFKGKKYTSFTHILKEHDKNLSEFLTFKNNRNKVENLYTTLSAFLYGNSFFPIAKDGIIFTKVEQICRIYDLNVELFKFVYDGTYFNLEETLKLLSNVDIKYNRMISIGEYNVLLKMPYNDFNKLSATLNIPVHKLLNTALLAGDSETNLEMLISHKSQKFGYSYEGVYYPSIDKFLEEFNINKSVFNMWISKNSYVQYSHFGYETVLRDLKEFTIEELNQIFFYRNFPYKNLTAVCQKFNYDLTEAEKLYEQYKDNITVLSILEAKENSNGYNLIIKDKGFYSLREACFYYGYDFDKVQLFKNLTKLETENIFEIFEQESDFDMYEMKNFVDDTFKNYLEYSKESFIESFTK